MNPNQLFVLSVLSLLGGVALLAFTDQTEVGVVMITTALGGGVGAKVWAAKTEGSK